jgi:acyl-coenzyme A thioesterase PaaI-like protein
MANSTLSIWQRMSAWPGGKWLFSRLVCLKAPYFSSISPRFVELGPGHAIVRMKKRRKVKNHIGTVHAIAICNLAEIGAGTMTDATVPKTSRWIPKGMSVEYLAKAETDLRAVISIDPIPDFGEALELPVHASVTDTNGKEVFRAVVTMWVTPKPA